LFGRQQVLKWGWVHGRSKEVPLHQIAPLCAQELILLGRFDAFGDDLQSEAVAHRNDGFHDGVVAAGPAYTGHERAIDLDMVRIEAAKIIERRVARAEIVDGNLSAGSLERANRF